jgi:cytochrome c oxidase subunit 2
VRIIFRQRAQIIIIILKMFINILTTVRADAAYPWQYGFQDCASPTHEGIIILHDSICFYLVLISCLVFWVLGSILVNFNSERQAAAIVHKYQTHGTLIELIWTITPALILVAIAFPSFKLLYLIGISPLRI